MTPGLARQIPLGLPAHGSASKGRLGRRCWAALPALGHGRGRHRVANGWQIAVLLCRLQLCEVQQAWRGPVRRVRLRVLCCGRLRRRSLARGTRSARARGEAGAAERLWRILCFHSSSPLSARAPRTNPSCNGFESVLSCISAAAAVGACRDAGAAGHRGDCADRLHVAAGPEEAAARARPARRRPGAAAWGGRVFTSGSGLAAAAARAGPAQAGDPGAPWVRLQVPCARDTPCRRSRCRPAGTGRLGRQRPCARRRGSGGASSGARCRSGWISSRRLRRQPSC